MELPGEESSLWHFPFKSCQSQAGWPGWRWGQREERGKKKKKERGRKSFPEENVRFVLNPDVRSRSLKSRRRLWMKLSRCS